jgi:hypothetical protein
MNPAAIAFLMGLLPGPTPAPGPPPTGVTPPPPPPPTEVVVDYPLGPMAMPDFAAPGAPFKLVDLRYDVSDTDHTTQAFAARLKVRDWGYLGASFEGERREITLTSQRLELSASGESGVYGLFGSYRAPWFIFSTGAETGGADEGSGWLVSPAVSVRLSPELEILAGATGNTRTPDDHFLRAASIGFRWQHGTRFEAAGQYARTHEVVEAGFENTRDSGILSVVGQVGATELRGEAFVEDVKGRFPRREGGGTADVRVPLAARLLAEGSAIVRFEQGSGLRSHEYRGALTWFGRRFYPPRAGEAAARSLDLARHATKRGGNERLALTDDERRAQRERLSLSRERGELGDEIDAQYVTEVAEREVPLLGLELVDTSDALPGVATQTVHAFVGVPWPPAWPWHANEAAVPFLRLDGSRQRQTSGVDYEAVTWASSLSVALNREMDLVLSWSRSDPTALDVIRGIGPRRTIELAYVYAFGR